MRRLIALALLLAAVGAAAHGAVVSQTVSYKSGETTLRGFLAHDDAQAGQRPGVLVIHEYWGLNEFAKQRARDLAALGYLAFAADMYGDGHVAATSEEAGKLSGQFRGRWEEGGRTLMRERARAGLAALRAQPLVDPARVAAIGYCFGGTTVLELAYSGAELAGVVSLHGGLTAPAAGDLPGLKAKILVLHGAADPSVSPEQIKTMMDGLDKAGADWQMIYYSGAKHAFTNPANTDPNNPRAGYHEPAARRSWQAMKQFFAELFQPA